MSAFQVFISYSTRNKKVVDDYVAKIESGGTACWVAPRNIPPGAPYAKAIMAGLNECAIFIVFISSSSIVSDDVLNEIDNAHSKKKVIVPIFIEDVLLTDELNYYLKRRQWLDESQLGRDGVVREVLKIAGIDKGTPNSISRERIPDEDAGDIGVYRVDSSLCIGCGTCVVDCPVEAITEDDANEVCNIDSDLCIGCGSCAMVCPCEAIVPILR